VKPHTPGPWSAIPDSGEDHEGDWYILTDEEEAIATGLSEPDARLIAAAPDLLAVCKRMVAEAGPATLPLNAAMVANFVTIYVDMRAIIAKAEGVS